MSLFQSNAKQSLTRHTLLKIAGRIAVVIVITTIISYYHIMSVMRTQTLEQLQKYVSERTLRERATFTLAEDDHVLLKKELMERLEHSPQNAAPDRFEQKYVRFPDGVVRNRRNVFDGKRQAGVYIDKSLPINNTLRRNILLFSDLCEQYGAAWHNRFQDTYITTPQNIMVLYWPEVPTWAYDAKADLFMPNEEYVKVASKTSDPARRTAWTGVYYDKVGKQWMVSVETPVDLHDVHVATIGHDILINELLDRTVKVNMAGTYNMIFRDDGNVIAHPKLMNEIEAAEGHFDVAASKDPHLRRQFQILKTAKSDVAVLDNAKDGEYLIAARIAELRWSFVLVYPKSLLAAKAFDAAKFILILGVAALMFELVILSFVLRRQIAIPLTQLIEATEGVTTGQCNVQLDTRRQDELGVLARSFGVMVNAVNERDALLEEQNALLEDQVAERTADLLAANEKLKALATTDPLTGLFNHRSLIATIDQELERCQRFQRTCALLFLDLDHFKALNDGYGHGAGDIALRELGGAVRECLRGIDTLGRWGGEEFVVLLPEITAEDALIVAERIRVTIAAHLFSVSGGIRLTCSLGVAFYPHDGYDRSSLVEAADRAMYAAKRLGRNQVRIVSDPALAALDASPEVSREEAGLLGTVEALAALVEARDQYTGEHTNGVALLTTQIALAMGLSPTEARMIGLVGKLHDIGKVAIPDAVLQKPEPLAESEWILMRTHPVIGEDVVSRVPTLRGIAPSIRGHHERWDGAGYPDGLAGEAIPLGSRIVAVADAYGAMTTDRPYRKACLPEQALEELRRCAGAQFDPDVVAAMEKVFHNAALEPLKKAA